MSVSTERSNLQLAHSGACTEDWSYANFLMQIAGQFPDATQFLNQSSLENADIDAFLSELRLIESGGFSHESVGGNYGREQLNAHKAVSRSCGYLGIARLLQRNRCWQRDDVLFDALAGNGTFDRVMQQLAGDMRPRYVGNDVSITMVRQAHSDNRLVFYSDLRKPILREAFADFGVSAYGTHHVPPPERKSFATSAGWRIKPGGTFVVQDFVEGSATARWYSECIDQFRSYGHAFKHFTLGELSTLLREAEFIDVSEHLIYDPFVIRLDKDVEDRQARWLFYQYLIDLFALDRLKRIAEAESLSLPILDNLFSPYFRLNDAELKEVRRDESVPCELVESEITIKTIDGLPHLIAPRVAIAAAGTRPIQI